MTKLMPCLSAIVLLTAGGCSVHHNCLPVMPTTTAVTPATVPVETNGGADVKKPFLFNEAPLPAGYPEPGPVGQVIVKKYSASRVAKTEQRPGEKESDLFNPLFKHIKKEKIAMSTPVAMDYSDEASKMVAMSFVYATPDLGKPGADGEVNVVDLPPATYVSVGVRGSYSDKHLQQSLKLIDQFLIDHSNEYVRAGTPRYLGYNSPFVPWFMRYGEVQVPVKTKGSTK